MHYLHLKVYDDVKEKKKMYPIVLLHGWPSSVREFYNLAPKLYEGNNDSKIVFDIVIPSLPGFGWSQVRHSYTAFFHFLNFLFHLYRAHRNEVWAQHKWQ